jgi:polyisoprenoid-binding protein YceI
MKPLLLIILPLSLFLFLVSAAQRHLKQDAYALYTHLEAVHAAAEQKDWSLAQTAMESAQDQWQPSKERWKAIMDHMEVDRIEMSFTRVKAWITLEQQKDCLNELAALMQMLRHVPEKERLTLSNIL